MDIRVIDAEMGLYYCSSRYYGPEVGRWISPDSIDYLNPESINGLNLYAYCLNNPVNYVDPTGYSAILIGLIIGAVIGAGLGVFAGMSFTANIPILGWINSGGALMYGVTGVQVLGVAGLLGATYMFAKGNGPRMGHNQYENKQFIM